MADPIERAAGESEGRGERAATSGHTDIEIVHVDSDLAEIVPDFIENRHGDVVRLRAALELGDFAQVRSLGHNMKGVGIGYGFDRISALGRGLELAGMNADAEQGRRWVDELECYLDRVEVVLR